MSEASMAKGSLAAQGAGGAMQAVGAFYSAKSQKMSLELQAKMDELNAQRKEMAARDVLMQGQQAEQAVRQQAAEIKSAQRAGMAAGGVDLSSVTAVAIQTSTDYLSELDAKTVQLNAIRGAWGQRLDAVNYRNSALMARASSKAISPFMAATSSILGSAAQMGMSYSSMKNAGMFSKASGTAPQPATGGMASTSQTKTITGFKF